ncbi:DUF1152 domain-containing protein [Janibacter hoylei]|uniref:DUF1152 domain-containing protein n=1 Tax=Janibacter hoylei TaxID=364298 RepID=UPI0022383F69|nr:DUF1152 domain-containing protein [Janibacter hoylei]MCW4602076.1 DUF1152 domain-containing protein [Janibacter hoylei]
MRTLYVAAGGGGDAVGALLARRALGDTDERRPLVTTCAWERLRIDPVPGPRARTDFTGLGLVDGEPQEVLPTSDTIPSGRSVLPRLAETGDARIFLHDFVGGALGLSDQLQKLAEALDVIRLVVVDVGGDIVARGHESNLKSPLADSLTLAAALRTKIPTAVVVLGPGADAELTEGEVLGLLEEVGATTVGKITGDDVRSLQAVLPWHPTEASALVAAGAEGLRGSVAMRRGHAPVRITDYTPKVWLAREPLLESFPLARALQGTTNLPEAEDVMRAAAVNEMDFERKVAEDPRRYQPPSNLPRLMADMEDAGATHITNRRLSEALGQQRFVAASATLRHKLGGLWSLDDLEQLADLTER